MHESAIGDLSPCCAWHRIVRYSAQIDLVTGVAALNTRAPLDEQGSWPLGLHNDLQYPVSDRRNCRDHRANGYREQSIGQCTRPTSISKIQLNCTVNSLVWVFHRSGQTLSAGCTCGRAGNGRRSELVVGRDVNSGNRPPFQLANMASAILVESRRIIAAMQLAMTKNNHTQPRKSPR